MSKLNSQSLPFQKNNKEIGVCFANVQTRHLCINFVLCCDYILLEFDYIHMRVDFFKVWDRVSMDLGENAPLRSIISHKK